MFSPQVSILSLHEMSPADDVLPAGGGEWGWKMAMIIGDDGSGGDELELWATTADKNYHKKIGTFINGVTMYW